MMSSKQTLSYMDPVVHGKVPRLEKGVGHMVSAGLCKPGNMQKYSLEDPLNYSGTYFTYCLTGQDVTELPPPWSPSGSCLQKGRNPVIHPLSAESALPNRFVYRSEDLGFSTENNPPVAVQDMIAAKEKCAYFGKSQQNVKHNPGAPSIHTPVAVRKLAVGGTTVSSQPENSVGLAIPKPIYGHGPCCTDHGCKSRACYIERTTDQVQHSSYEEEWRPVSGLHYGPMFPMEKREELLQQRVLQLEQNTGRRFPPKEASPEGFRTIRPAEAVRLPTFIEPDYRRLPYDNIPRSYSNPSKHPLQFPPKMYHGILPSSSRNYEDMQKVPLSHSQIPPNVYQERSPVSSYPQLPQRHVFYYPQENVDLEKGAAYKDLREQRMEEASSNLNKQRTQNVAEQYLVPQPFYSEVPLPYHMISTSVPFHRDYDLAPYSVYKMQPSAGRKRGFPEESGSPLQMHLTDQPMDYSSQKVQMTSPSRELNRHRRTPGAFHPVHARSVHVNPEHVSFEKQLVVNSRTESEPLSPKRGIPYSVIEHHKEMTLPVGPNTDSGAGRVTASDNRSSKTKAMEDSEKSIVINSTPTEPSDDLYEVAVSNKRHERKTLHRHDADKLQPPRSPPMPVINNVFSLAPYKAYLEASGMLPMPNSVKSVSHYCPQTSDQQRLKNDPQQTTSTHGLSPSMCGRSEYKKELEDIETADYLNPEQNTLQADENKNDNLQQDLKEEGNADLMSSPNCLHNIKVLDLRVKKTSDSGSQAQTLTDSSSGIHSNTSGTNGNNGHASGTANLDGSRGVSITTFTQNKYHILTLPPPNPETLPHKPSEPKISAFKQLSAQCLKLPTFKIILPDTHLPIKPIPSSGQELLSASTESKSNNKTYKHTLPYFMELHQSLCSQIANSITHTPEEELRIWLTKTEGKTESGSPPTKSQNISSIMGAIGREAWLKFKENAVALRSILDQLENYISEKQCPFPHVMRTGTIFIPMLVVKESLFPQVPGSSIDQVLQEHRVELRPTTLSEERLLTQLQKRGCSSKLRRLLSLKQLPDIYPDVLNLYYHSCVREHLDSTSSAGLQISAQLNKVMDIVNYTTRFVFLLTMLLIVVVMTTDLWEEPNTTVKTEKEEHPEETFPLSKSRASFQTMLRKHGSECKGGLMALRRGICFKTQRRKGRRKSALNRTFLGKDNLGQIVTFSANLENSSLENSVEQDWERPENCLDGDCNKLDVKIEDVSSEVVEITKKEPESSSLWGPITSDLSSENSDAEMDETLMDQGKASKLARGLKQKEMAPSGETKPQVSLFSKCHSSMVLKLNALFKKNPIVRDRTSEIQLQPANSITEAGREDNERVKGTPRRLHSRGSQQRQRVPGIAEALRPTRSTSKVLHLRSSMVQIKFRRYLTVQRTVLRHSAQRRRKRVVRSAVRRVRQAMKTSYPELVGKRIRHLYEENDKSEVWYRGVVIRVHEPHPNPLKTVYEVKYDSEPEWQYYLELLLDYKKGWLKLED